MSLHSPAILQSWQAGFKKTRSFAHLLATEPGSRNQVLNSYQRRESSNIAQRSAQRKSGTSQTPKRTIPKPNQTLISRSPKPAEYEPLTEKLAIRAAPTLLYRASSYANYLFGCYATGGGLLAAAWFNFQTQFYVQPGGVPSWVPVFTSIGSFMIACGGFWMLLKVNMLASPCVF